MTPAEDLLPPSLRVGVWSTTDGNVTSNDLASVLNAILHDRERCTAFMSARGNSDRRVDRATQLLRRAGVIEFAGGKWRVVVPREVAP